MPKRIGNAYFLNIKKNILGKINPINIDELTTNIPEIEFVTEIILEKIAGEDVTAGNIGTIIDNMVYKASNLAANNKPGHGIILNSASSGGKVQIQVAGNCPISATLTANKEVYLRYGSNNMSQTPLITPTINEDGLQRIGTAIKTNIILIKLDNFTQIE